ncbi:MAG: phosphoribosylformylglycinamidine synthase subunit PurS [Candidatus Bathyarchaeota archaeon]|nr:phosphoribosylformylglycinamidine synthase subunit PurS [Candidatus Bathyarchaeota archaeon]MDW8039901.1 phosphoribosylformylglycinamidine synthase subunit PurS [Nitrososphaerota archaeon]
MKFRLKVEVGLKPGHSDPEGETAARLLKELGYKVERVNVSKVYTILLEAGSKNEALLRAEEMCRRLLANPTKDNYTITVEEEK